MLVVCRDFAWTPPQLGHCDVTQDGMPVDVAFYEMAVAPSLIALSFVPDWRRFVPADAPRTGAATATHL